MSHSPTPLPTPHPLPPLFLPAQVAIDQHDAAVVIHERVAELLARYNEVVSLVSQKFLYWDYMLRLWEARVDEALAEQGSA